MARLTIPSDQSLAIQLQGNNLSALTHLIDRYQAPLLRYVQYLGVMDDYEDIVQETFIKMYKNIQSYNPNKKFSSWIYRIAHNTAISSLRSRRFTIPWEEYLDSFMKVDPIDNIDQNIAKDQVEMCLGQLPLHYREPLALFYLEEKSYSEIMDILRLPMGTVSARINRAKQQMRTICQKISK